MSISKRVTNRRCLLAIVAIIISFSLFFSGNLYAQDLPNSKILYLNVYFGDTYSSNISITNIDAVETDVKISAYNANGNMVGLLNTVWRIGASGLKTINSNQLPAGKQYI